ncbi:hypothetical protein [Ideonella sp. A 288]|uniref:hypothetical protein n=1 Tax=Ideonella sp. A 288 TaxID=1962181 RepID=UPI000B4B78E5|nr:hypothetical protein [Ideonella sp. A 288]
MPEAAARGLLGISASLATPGTPAPPAALAKPDGNPWRARIEHQRWQANVRRALADTNMTAAQIVAAYGPRPTR